MEEEDDLDAVYEDDVLEIISLSDEEGEHRIEDIEEHIEEMQLDGAEDGEIANESDEEESVTTFKPLRDDAIGCFMAHKGPVFTVSLDHTSSLVCTGGQDDRAFVWRLLDMKIMFECTGHKDSVTSCGFSHDDKYLCTADLSGLVQVWLTADHGQVVWSFETSQVEWVVWHPQAHVLLCGTSDGEAWLWRIPSGDCKTLPSSGYGNMVGTLLPDGKRLCCGYFDGSVKMWDLKTTSQIYSLTNQTSPVTCLSCHGDGNRLIVGYMNGASQLVSTSEAKVLAVFTTGSEPSSSDDDESSTTSVESVAFAPGQQCAFVAMVTGVLTAWDLATQKMRYSCKPETPNCGVVKLVVSGSCPVLYSCHLDGVVRRRDMMSGVCQGEWHGHSAGILDMVLTRDESRIITTSDDGSVRLFNNTDHTSLIPE